VPESRLTPETLAAAVDVAHDGPPPARGTVALDGAEKTAEFVGARLAG
jgi:predicted glycosyltransferase